MSDYQMRAFLERNALEIKNLAEQSDILQVVMMSGYPPNKYILRFHAPGLVRDPATGEIATAPFCDVGIWFPDDYLTRCVPFEVVTWLHPAHAWNPHVMAPFACLGHLNEGMRLVDIAHQAYEVWTYQNVNWRDPLNQQAADWGRCTPERFPIDSRPLKRRHIPVQLEEKEAS